MSNSPLARKYSKYQKSIIKSLTTTLGVIPFSYEKTQSNHLKVLIDGVEKPLYTSSTPSDINSQQNFMSLVRQEVRAIDEKVNALEIKHDRTPTNKEIKLKFSREKILIVILKSLRNIVPSLESREYKLVIDAASIEPISAHRKLLIDESIKRVRRDQKGLAYMPIKELKTLKKDLKIHIDFILPSVAYYAKRLNELGKIKSPVQNSSALLKQKNMIDKSFDNVKNNLPVENITNEYSASQNVQKTVGIKQQTTQLKEENITNIQQLATMPETARISMLQQLSNSQGKELIDNIKKAMVLNREADLLHVIRFMHEKNISLDDIGTHLTSSELDIAI
jgi:hypothetical protein